MASPTTPRRTQAMNPQTAVNFVLIGALVALCVFFSTQSTSFFTVSNITLLLQNGAALGALCVPMTVLIISGKIDLSVGSSVALTGTLAALATGEWNLGPGMGILIAISVGIVVGALNGLLCAILEFNAIIVTLGMLAILRGVTMLIHPGDIYLGSDPIFQGLGTGTFLAVPLLVWIALGVFALGALFAARTPWGRYSYAIGVNPAAAYLSALPVRALPFWLYVATGAGAGLAGVMMTARLSGASPGSQGVAMEMDALTVILLGGVAFTGGRGRILGVFTAWIFLAALQDGLILMNASPNVQRVASGTALVVAAALDAFTTVFWPRIVKARQARQRGARDATGSSVDDSASATRPEVELIGTKNV